MQPSTEVQRRLEGATGYAFSVDQQTNSKGQRFTARPGGLPRLHGFSIEVLVGWRTLSSRFIPDTFAADLLQSMSDAPPDKRETFSRMARTLGESGLQVALKTDELDCDPAATEGWPDTWKTVDIRVETGPHDISEQAMAEEVADIALAELSLLLSLLPVQDGNPDDPSTLGEAEGRRIETGGTRYERSAANRAACIALKGTTCSGCGLSLEHTYGAHGRGYIEVHHSSPVSTLADRPVDILHDLHPLCPNCHAMVHRDTPPMKIEQLRILLRERQFAASEAKHDAAGSAAEPSSTPR